MKIRRLVAMGVPLGISAMVIAFMSFGTTAGAEADDPVGPTTTVAKITYLEPTGEAPTPPAVTGVEYLTGDGKVIGDRPLHYGENVIPFPRRPDGTCDTPKSLGSYGVEGAGFRGHVSIDITVDASCNVVARMEYVK